MSAPGRKRTYRIVPVTPVPLRVPVPERRTECAERAPAAVPTGDPPSPEVLALELNGCPRRTLISEAAYYRSLGRRAGPDPVGDWLAAEREIDARLSAAEAARSGAAALQPGSSRNAARSQA